MAIAIYTDEALRRIATVPSKLLSNKMAGRNLREILLFRRNLQISLAAYSTKYPSKDGRLDKIQAGIIWVCRQIEMRAREAFMKYYFPRLWPEAKSRGMSKLTLKQELQTRWEKLLSRTGY